MKIRVRAREASLVRAMTWILIYGILFLSSSLLAPTSAITIDMEALLSSSGVDGTSSLPLMPKLPGLNLLAGISLLKKRDVGSITYANLKIFDPEMQCLQSFDDRMRFIDSVRRYLPIPSETVDLNLPDERLNLHEMQHILLMCGGYKSVRFTQTELFQIQDITKALNQSFEYLETEYKKHPSKIKKMKLEEVQWITHDKIYLKLVSQIPCFGDISTIDLTKYFHLPPPSSPESESVHSSHNEILRFHVYADMYCYKMAEIQKFVIGKQSEIVVDRGKYPFINIILY